MYNIGICSEDKTHEKIIIKMCRNIIKVREDTVLFHVFSSTEEIAAYQGTPFVFMFLDMKLLRFVNTEQYRKLQKLARAVICVNQFEKNKPFDDRLRLTMIPAACERMFTFKRSCPEGEIPESAIRYLHAENNYVRVYLEEKTLLFAKTLKLAQQILGESDIIRIHRSVMVNLAYVDGIRNNHVFLYDQTCLPIGRSYKEKVKQLVLAYKCRQ